MKAIADIVRIDPRHPLQDIIERAAALVRQAGVVVFPTSGLYGLGADALNPQAVQRVFAVKGRPPDQPLLVLIGRRDTLDQVARPVTPLARYLMDELWPGRITFVVAARAGLSRGLTGGSGKIGVRLPLHPVAAALVQTLGRPLTATSANPTGAAGCAAVTDLAPSIRASVDLVLDAGQLTGGTGSSVVDVSGDAPQILRQGAVPAHDIHAAVQRFKRLTTPNGFTI